MEYVFVFDVDGTLTPARKPIVSDFAAFFRQFVAENPVYLISGSNYGKIEEQLPGDILNSCSAVFGSSGAEHFQGGKQISRKEHTFAAEVRAMCEDYVSQSPYPIRTGTHIEERPGMLNISSVGRQATHEQRHAYATWDQEHQERARFAEAFNKRFDEYEASAGGEISIDIVPKGWNKSVILPSLLSWHPGAALLFFGDRMRSGGNDKPLGDAITKQGQPHQAVPVDHYNDTWGKLASKFWIK